jgi:hypothetical protein
MVSILASSHPSPPVANQSPQLNSPRPRFRRLSIPTSPLPEQDTFIRVISWRRLLRKILLQGYIMKSLHDYAGCLVYHPRRSMRTITRFLDTNVLRNPLIVRIPANIYVFDESIHPLRLFCTRKNSQSIASRTPVLPKIRRLQQVLLLTHPSSAETPMTSRLAIRSRRCSTSCSSPGRCWTAASRLA